MQCVSYEDFVKLMSVSYDGFLFGFQFDNDWLVKAAESIVIGLDKFMSDGEWLRYWVFDLCFGSLWEPWSVHTDTEDIPYRTAKQVYDFLSGDTSGAWRKVSWDDLLE